MPDFADVLLATAAATAFWSLIGLPLARHVVPPTPAWFLAPALGWAIHGVLALLLFSLTGMSRPLVLAADGACVAIAVAVLWRGRALAGIGRPAPLVTAAIFAAALLALVPLAGVLPKATADGVTLAPPIFDHSKIALIDEMIRSGVPPTNPFYGEAGPPERVSYYFLWHFSAAVVAVSTGLTGWAADAGLTWFTAFASLLVVVGLAVAISGRASAATIAVALAATTSARTVLGWMFGMDAAQAVVGEASGFGGWLFQVCWAPQHVAAAMCVVMACWLMAPSERRTGLLALVIVGLLVAAAYQSSIWVGGVTFAVAAAAVGTAVLAAPGPQGRARFVMRSLAAAALALALAAPLLGEQFVAAALRGSGFPVTIRPVDALGEAFSGGLGRWLDLPAYWLVYLPVEFPAFYPAGAVMLVVLWNEAARAGPAAPPLRALALSVAASLLTAWLLASTLGVNNDLGWRAVLPAVMVLTALAAAGVARALAAGAYLLPALAACGMLLAVPETAVLVRQQIAGDPLDSAADFARSRALWEAVRRHVAADERIASNPLFLAGMTPWPVNISWALMADRRSCYAGSELALAFASMPAARRAEVDAQFARVFDGHPAAGDLTELARRFRCDVVVVTPRDGAWRSDPFASSTVYSPVERTQAWRIYRRAMEGPSKP